jgi:hypothetical protein
MAIKRKGESKRYKELRLTMDDVNTLSDAMMLLAKTSNVTKKYKTSFKELTKIDENTR